VRQVEQVAAEWRQPPIKYIQYGIIPTDPKRSRYKTTSTKIYS